ncbi:uncharacterized protein [Temnothorax longispinosus]|uniref:uncharacterized protein n=1 Tax=Temnothorax longispinosus TaxID=300112 RepID=UPI003A9A2DF9
MLTSAIDSPNLRKVQALIVRFISKRKLRGTIDETGKQRCSRIVLLVKSKLILRGSILRGGSTTSPKTSRHHTSSSEHRTSTTSKTDGWDKVDPAAPPKRSAFDSFKSTTTQQSTQNSSLSPQHDHAWLDGLNSPLIQDEGDSKMLKLRFDVSQYTPEEIVVKTVDNKLLVHAKHEEKTESKSVYREYNREFLLPKGTNPESIKSSLSKDGVLTVEAPLPAIGSGEKLIPIAHQ